MSVEQSSEIATAEPEQPARSTFHICWGPQKVMDGYRCRCCGDVFRNIDSMLGATCYPCGFGMNGHCEQCVTSELGVEFNRFRKGRMLHRLAAPTPQGEPWRARCGYTVPPKEVGNATAVIDRHCRHCWPDQDVEPS